ncbi:shikimate dehydrogenase [Nitrosococcus oceani ATCC 19707]|uniref:Shikimate dehydrogenase (NADP(+)) n=2 Tax=Nitrosococcus oceani TaxID=1229 RepID=AROE_NITOC|nr:RecName: Full=Shikimate dehydrogenase (NADP(+)); Short=SDH [Nitrosococcus oceani ATCC 19707]ABA59028.1 shikimate dehydrogenase [Nitrosococcus oceani ATCC 19707]KFI18551.1 shikimate dehydrogenase [Nitrosococcus oceani C-27]KFI21779.1 shikimate dehydrogenase [Nitrosococcus oceani]GEM21209.1 shikimate dehydrogenase (NADP(+)) [Nitrosococcus oceani]
MPDRYAVMGNPIAHSKSPQIHTAFAQQTGQALTYTGLQVEAGKLAEAITAFQQQEGKGLNITIPLKAEAWRLVDQCSPQAQRAKAVNTILLEKNGALLGDNTDGVGLVRDLINNHGGRITGQQVLLLGAGGAASGVIEALLKEHPSHLIIVNRTPAKAIELAARFSPFGAITGGGYELLENNSFHLIINATASSLQGELPPLPRGILRSGGWVYDMMYGNEPTIFMKWGQTHGAARSLDGLGMLVEQAAEAFFIWRKVRPKSAPIIAQLRREMDIKNPAMPL